MTKHEDSSTLSEHLQRNALAAPHGPFEQRRHDTASTRQPVTRRFRINASD